MNKFLARITFAFVLVLAYANTALAQGTFVHRKAPDSFATYSDTVFRVCTSNDAAPCTTASIYSDAALSSAITQTSGVTLPGSKHADFYIANGNYVIQWYSVQGGAGYYTETLQAPMGPNNTSITLGLAGSNVGALKMQNATSGTITVSPVSGALGTVTLSLPAATDTLVGKATTDSLSNKSFPTAGFGLTNATSGTITVAAPTGALATPTVTIPAVTGGLIAGFSCGDTGSGSQSCTATAVNGQMHMYNGRSTLSSNAATITFPIAFTSTTSFFCVAQDVTTRANPVQMVPASASTATITNTTGASDSIQWICSGQ